MYMRGKKIIATSVVATMFLVESGVCNVAFAQQATQEKADIKTRINQILEPKVEVRTIPKGNAYIPKETIINKKPLSTLS